MKFHKISIVSVIDCKALIRNIIANIALAKLYNIKFYNSFGSTNLFE